LRKARTLYEEIWECRFPKRQTIEEDLLSLQALTPDMAEDLHSLFKEAVTDSLASILGQNEARALVKQIAGTDFESPYSVFGALDSILHGGSQILRDAIVEEFRVNVHLLLEKTERKVTQSID
jgi:hypothetical protein